VYANVILGTPVHAYSQLPPHRQQQQQAFWQASDDLTSTYLRADEDHRIL
jgi:hypothetical protein